MSRFKLTSVVALCLFVVAVGIVALTVVNHLRFISKFDNVQLGETKQTIVQALGQPDEIEYCTSSHEPPTDRCVEIYWYISFMERRGISFDGHGKVIDKTYNVSH